jgi:tetratricopeptide (TPR) repeat protein
LKRDEAIGKAVDLHRQGRLDEARQIYLDVLAVRDTDASTIHLLGLTYLDGSSWQQGIALIERAIELQPARAVFHFNLGVGHRNHGNFTAANCSYQRAIELQEDYGEAWGAWVATQHYTEAGDDLSLILKQLQQPLEDDNQCFFQFSAGKICDDIGDHAAAFGHFQQGNGLKQKAWKEAEFGKTCEGIRSVFTADFLSQRAAGGVADASPIFIVGMPRSGSSLVEQILAGHPQVFGAGELPDIPSIVADMGKRMKPIQPYPVFVPFLPAQVFTGFGAAYLDRVAKLAGQTGLRSVDKLPSNFLHVGMIRLLFPGAKIIHSRRHPLDTCLSCYVQNFAKGQEFSTDLETLGRYFNEYSVMMRHWHEVLPGQVFDLDYETLVDQTEPTVRKLLEFCDLPWDERCLDFTGTQRRVSTASAWQVRQPLHNRSIGRWRHYEQQLAPLKDIIDIDIDL